MFRDKMVSGQVFCRMVRLLAIPIVLFCLKGHAQWLQTGPQGGIVQSLLVVDSTVYAVSPDLGILKSVDQGQSWTISFNFYWVESLTQKGDDLYAGGADNIYKSTDQGNTWTSCLFMWGYGFRSLATNSSAIFAVTGGGIVKSTDDGQTWVSSDSGLPASDVCSVFTDSIYVFAGTYSSGLYRSVNNGNTWSHVGLSGTTPLSMKRCSGYLLCGTGSRIFRSADNGLNWTEVLNAGTAIRSIVTDSLDLYAASYGQGFYFSGDLGEHWSLKTNNMPDVLVNALAFSGPVLIAGSDCMAAARSLDHGASWSIANNGIRSLRIQALYASGNELYTGTTMEGLFSSGDGGVSWQNLGLPFDYPGITAIARKDSLLFAARSHELYRKNLSDTAWTLLPGYPPFSATVLKVKGNWLFAGTNLGGFLRSMDNGTTWQSCTGCFTDSSVVDIEVKDNKVFSICPDGEWYVSGDDGGTWTSLGLTEYAGSHILASNQDYLFVGVNNKIYRSSDNGTTLEPINNGLPSYFSPADIIAMPGYLVLALMQPGLNISNLYISTDNGSQWKEAGTGMADYVLNLAYIGDTIYCGTWITGVWKRYIYNILSANDQQPGNRDLIIFPNPSGDFITIRLPGVTGAYSGCEIVDITGKKVAESRTPFNRDIRIDIRNLLPGTYILVAYGRERRYSGLFKVK